MSRYPRDHKDRTRAKILDAAGRLFRHGGYSAVGLATVMQEAGLTVGGFYAHFPSKEALFTEVLARTLSETRRLVDNASQAGEGRTFVVELARQYLSRTHRDAVEHGCPLPALATEIARQSAETRAEFDGFYVELLQAFESHLPEWQVDQGAARDRAIALLALFVGGMVFARAAKSEKLSDRILLACRRHAAIGMST